MNAQAREEGITAAGLIAKLLDDRERQERIAAFGRAIRGADADYWDEFRVWDQIAADDRG